MVHVIRSTFEKNLADDPFLCTFDSSISFLSVLSLFLHLGFHIHQIMEKNLTSFVISIDWSIRCASLLEREVRYAAPAAREIYRMVRNNVAR